MASDTLQGLASAVAEEPAESLSAVRELFEKEEAPPSSISMVLASPEHRDAVLAWAHVMWAKGMRVEIADEVGSDQVTGELAPFIRAEAWAP